MDEVRSDHSWEAEFADLLGELSSTQSELLDLLAQKRTALRQADSEALSAIANHEELLIARDTVRVSLGIEH